MKQPLLPVALLFIGGILAGEWLHPPLFALFAASFALAVAALAVLVAVAVFLYKSKG